MKPSESFIGQPIRSLQTMLRTIAKYNATASSVIPDGIYGKETVAAITEFQISEGLPPTGITDQQTWERIVEAYDEAIISVGPVTPIEVLWDPNVVFLPGDEGPYIYLAQSMLLYLSGIHSAISKPTSSGRLDPETSKAISTFQELNSLPPTGSLDRKTWKNLSHQFTLHANARSLNI